MRYGFYPYSSYVDQHSTHNKTIFLITYSSTPLLPLENVVRKKIIQEAVYKDVELLVLYKGKISQLFHTNFGLKQRCTLLPQLFTIFSEKR